MADNKPTGDNPAVAEQVLEEVKRFGEDQKKQNDAFQKSVDDLQTEIKGAKEAQTTDSGEFKKKLDDFTTDITTRMEAAQEANQKRMDEMETKFLRTPDGEIVDMKNYDKEFGEAFEFKCYQLMTKGKSKVRRHEVEAMVDVDGYKKYCKAFESYMRLQDVKLMEGEEFKTLSEGSDSAGGYWVPPQYTNQLVQRRFESGVMRSMANVVRISSDKYKIPAVTSDISAAWGSELGTISLATTPKAGLETIDVHDVHTWPDISQDLLEDAIFDPESWLANISGDRLGRKEGTGFISDNGVGKPYGILSYPAWAVAGTYEHGKLEQVKTLSTSGATLAGLLNIQKSLLSYYDMNASFLMNKIMMAAILITAVDGDSSYALLEELKRSGLKQPTILGYPVRFDPNMPNPTSASLSLAFGDFREGYTIVDRVGVAVLRDPYTATPKVIFKVRARVGGAVVNFEAIKIGVCSA